MERHWFGIPKPCNRYIGQKIIVKIDIFYTFAYLHP